VSVTDPEDEIEDGQQQFDAYYGRIRLTAAEQSVGHRYSFKTSHNRRSADGRTFNGDVNDTDHPHRQRTSCMVQ